MRSLLWLAALAFASEIGNPVPSGNEGFYRINPNDFYTTEQDEVAAGAAAWNAGPGRTLRGADWIWTRGSDRTDTTLSNGYNEVYMRSQAWMDNHVVGNGALAVTLFGSNDTDIVFSSGWTWSTDTPSTAGAVPIGQVAAHEFGHRLGFSHENDVIALMNQYYPFGGDMGMLANHFRLNEDDSVGLQFIKPDSSTGQNLMLSRFSYWETNGVAFERWDTYGADQDPEVDGNLIWDKSDDDFDGNHPGHILAMIVGTGSAGPLVEWRVVGTTQTDCFDGVGTEYTVGTNAVSISPNTPYSIGPDSWNFSSVPNGTYHLCAKIDADNQVSETSEADNIIRSEATVEVRL